MDDIAREKRDESTGGCRAQAQLAGALAGDESALRRLVELLTPVIQTRIGQRLLVTPCQASPRQAVDDLTQEVFMLLFKDDAKILRDWQPAGGLSLENFVGLVARRQAISMLRSRRRNPTLEQTAAASELERPSAAAGPERQRASRELLRRLFDRFRAELSPRGWQLFELLFVRERTVEEIGQITQLSEDAIYKWRSRLREKARQIEKDLDAREPKTPWKEGW